MPDTAELIAEIDEAEGEAVTKDEEKAAPKSPKATKIKPQYDPKVRDAALTDIAKRFGEGAIMALNSKEIVPVDVIPTGSIGLDLALGVGGIPRGRITELYGPESSGKTTICQHILAEAQKLGGGVAYIDMEHALDPAYAQACGVDLDTLYLAQPDNGEQALEITEALIDSKQWAAIVVDSIAALVPQSELDGDMGDATMGKHARLMSQAMRKISPKLKGGNTALIFTNQLRQKIGVMFGNPETTTGGMAMKFYASVRLDVRRIQSLKDGQEVTGSRTRVRVTKNKVAPPFRECEFDIMYAGGISKVGDLLDVASRLEVVTKRGAFFSYKDERLGQGRDKSVAFLHEHPDMAAEIYANVMAEAKHNRAAIVVSADTSEPD